jgi:hypothetical protein
MAFQTGSRVDPRLLDYSGYAQGMTQAAAINAQALASLGQAVGKGIEEFNEKKLQKEQKKQATPMIASFLRQIDPSLSEEQSNAGASSFINSVGIEGVQAAIPVFALEGMKSQNKIKLAQIEAFGELAEQETLSITDQQKVSEGFEPGGVYTNQGFSIVGGQVVQEINTKPGFNIGDILPGRSEYKQVPVTSGPVYDAARKAGLLAQTPELNTSTIGQPQVGTGTVLTESDAIPNSLDLDIPEEEAPTLSQIEDITTQVDYGEFDVPKPKIIEQEGFKTLTATNRPKTFKEFVDGMGKRKGDARAKYEAYLKDFEYKYPQTYEKYSRGAEGDMTQSYTDIYLPRFY